MPINSALLTAAIKDDASPDAMLAYLTNRAEVAVEEGRSATPLPDFFDPARDWPQVLEARTWWLKLKDVQKPMHWDHSVYVAMNQYCNASPDMHPTLLASLTQQAKRIAEYKVANGADPEHPTEDRAERMRRLNRERVAAHRERQRAAADTDASPAVRTAKALAWDAVVAARQARAQVVAMHDAKVREAYNAMTQAATDRSTAKAEQDVLVAEAEAAHKAAG